MDLRKLRHVHVLAEEGNFTRAARRLNLTQPALTRSVQSLETALSLRLFDRHAGGVRPTVDGERVLEHARAMLRLESSLRSEVGLLARGDAGRVAFGIGPMLVPILGPVLARVLGKAPMLEVRVEIESVHVLAELLLDNRIDFFVADILHARTVADLEATELHAIAAGYFIRADHPLAGRAAISAADLRAYPLASPALVSGGEVLLDAPVPAITCEDCATLKQVTLATDAVMLGMNLSMQPELDEGRIVALPVVLTPGGHSQVGVVQRAGRTRSAAAQRIIAAFDAELAFHAKTASGSA
ncbi:LysR family transcriptional regulator [Rhizorhapis sp. SPR117]|uniref:LysR family transcriptional regulator n=1 Tax=Rhizorhapis sp. SPR117 TaxID=2912611 RepID=UPI001F3A8647|nr:LysR family transcriptional regulator [Rhizorhapis sp. SPR117]